MSRRTLFFDHNKQCFFFLQKQKLCLLWSWKEYAIVGSEYPRKGCIQLWDISHWCRLLHERMRQRRKLVAMVVHVSPAAVQSRASYLQITTTNCSMSGLHKPAGSLANSSAACSVTHEHITTGLTDAACYYCPDTLLICQERSTAVV